MKTAVSRPIGVDLFAGAGGLSLGFEQAGFDVVAAVEIDPVHSAVHKFNFPNCAMIPKSISDLSGKDIRRAASLGNRNVDVVFGGAPCQGFSLIGQRALEDPRNSLVREFVRIVKELNASYFVFENVKGLTLGKHRKFLLELIEAFEDIGYNVHRDWQVLNAVNFGVPQQRERLILLGGKKRLPLPDYPLPFTRPAGQKKSKLDLPPGPSCFDALNDLPEAEDYQTLTQCDSVRTNRWGAPSNYAADMRCIGLAAWHFGYRRRWDSGILTSSLRTDHTEISRSRFASVEQGTVEPISRFFKLPSDGVSNTLRAGTDSARGAFTSPRPIHYARARCITVREMARLHGFPDWFRLHATKWHGARQVGNSVPPPLARAVASKIIEALKAKPTRPRQVLTLGDPHLLEMDMTQASEYWGVTNPIRRRDRKSGARKRKQEDIERMRISGKDARYG